jgi:hypothetical protein
MNTENKELLDQFAMTAMASLIAKLPLYDVKGEEGIKVSQEELTEIKKGITQTAYEYASYMIIARQRSLKWLEENNL